MIDLLNIEYAACQENVEIYAFHHKHYIHGVYYDKTKETYDKAYDRALKEMWDKIKKDNPHLQFANSEPDKPIINLAPLERGISNNRVESEPCNYHSPDIEAIKKEMQSYKIGAKAFKAVYELQVKDNPELKEIYEQKLKELQ
jgi:hypothetical protein